MKKILFILLSFMLGSMASAQPYTIDPSYSPFFDVRNNLPFSGRVNTIWENPKNGKVFIGGRFNIDGLNGVPPHSGYTQTDINGNYINTFATPFMHSLGLNISGIYPINDSVFAVNRLRAYGQYDSLGTLLNNSYNNNYYQSVTCRQGSFPYFFKDGSVLIPNHIGTQPTSCQINSYNQTFPHQYIVKLNAQGFYDSSFQANPNIEPTGFVEYDSNRILVYGLPRDFTMYNGKSIDGLCRIYHDGSLDTSFTSPLLSSLANSSFEIKQVNADGSFFINGRFFLKNDTVNKYRYLVKLKPNGTIDSSFNFHIQLTLNALPSLGGNILAIEPTDDRGYIVGGLFNSYNGHVKNSLVKLDSVGNVEPQYFTSIGPDSSGQNGAGLAGVLGITKSHFGGYYVYGDFLKWDGQPSQPIVRIHDITTGIESSSPKLQSLQLWPNPSDGIVNISKQQSIKSIRIYSLQGQLVKNIQAKQNQFKLPEKTGIYLIRIKDQEGNIFSKKIVKN